MPTLAVNKRARYDYEVLETFQAGLMLTGAEVKSCKAGQVSLKSTFVTIKQAPKLPEFYLTNAVISAYKFARQDDYNPSRPRRLLLNKKEIERLAGKTSERGLTLVPIKMFTKNNLIKLEFALARGKKLHDKREDIKRRDLDRQLKRSLTTR